MESSGSDVLYAFVFGRTVSDTTSSPIVFRSHADAESWANGSGSILRIWPEPVLNRREALKQWEFLVSLGRQQGWLKQGPQPDPVEPGASDEGGEVYMAHDAMIARVFRNRSDAEAAAHLEYLRADKEYAYAVHEVRVRP